MLRKVIMMKKITEGLYAIKLPIPRGGFESFLTAWLIKDSRRGQTILVETGPSSVVPVLLEELKEAGIDKIDFLIYTHIHLDHAGGAGSFVTAFPETPILVPEGGRRHLAEPSKLLAASRASLGELCDAYGPVFPVPQEKLLADSQGIEGLTVIDTPGHAPFHSSYLYELEGRKILFAGEAAGCRFDHGKGKAFLRPATPHKFYYDTAMTSLEKLLALKSVDLVCYPHSGCTAEWKEALETSAAQNKLWLEIISALPEGTEPEEAVKLLMEKDPMLKELSQLPELVQQREKFYLKQSARGFLGWVKGTGAK